MREAGRVSSCNLFVDGKRVVGVVVGVFFKLTSLLVYIIGLEFCRVQLLILN